MKNQLKRVFKFIFFGTLFLLLFSSCRFENIITSPDNENSIVDEDSVIADLISDVVTNDGSNDNIIDFANCFNLKLPITVIANGTEVDVDINEDFDLIRTIFDQSTTDTDIIEIEFPVTAILTDYSEVVLNNQNEFDTLSNTCNDENEQDDDIECVDFLYPLSFTVFNTITEQTNQINIQNDHELYVFVENLNVDDVASLNFPVTLIFSDGAQETVNNLEELEILIDSVKDTCDEDDDFDYTDDNFRDTQSPSTPTNLTASNITQTTVDLSWNASIDNIAVTTYAIYVDGIFVTSTSTTSTSITNLVAGSSYTFTVLARDASSNNSIESNPVVITTLISTDITPPTAPVNLIVSNITQTTVDLMWDASTDNIEVTSYDVYSNGALIGSTNSISYNVASLTESTSYTFTVIARDAASNSSISSNAVLITTLTTSGDTEAPTTPLNLIASNITNTTTDLSWDASNDNIAVIGYEIYIDGTLLKFVNTTTCDIINLTPMTGYTFTVLAKDAEGNSSALSNTASITTLSSTQQLDINDVLVTCTNWNIDRLEDDGDDDTGEVSNIIFNFATDGTVQAENTSTNEIFTGTWQIRVNNRGKTKLRIRIPDLDDVDESFNANWTVTTVIRSDGTTTIELNSGDKILIFSTRSCS